MERLLSMPYCAKEEEFVLRYRQNLEAQSRKQVMPVLERDERGVAFSTADGTYTTPAVKSFTEKHVDVSGNSTFQIIFVIVVI